jgi:hypothetical protein
MSLEAVKEESLEDEGDWKVVQRSKRGGSMPCRDKTDLREMRDKQLAATASMEVEAT